MRSDRSYRDNVRAMNSAFRTRANNETLAVKIVARKDVASKERERERERTARKIHSVRLEWRLKGGRFCRGPKKKSKKEAHIHTLTERDVDLVGLSCRTTKEEKRKKREEGTEKLGETNE